ncbi:MAG: flavodoxin [Clostridia bacterium]|nr:flavodoxin [Clostridia bacterium]
MKTIVVYTSQSGFTRRYAEWIAQAAGADCMDLKEAARADLTAYDAVVFGGSALAGTIRRLGWLRRRAAGLAGRKLIVFCVGASPIDDPGRIEADLSRNLQAPEFQNVQAFYCPGGLDYSRMPVSGRAAMGLLRATLKLKRRKTEDEQKMLAMISSSYDISDRKYIEPILTCLKE